MTRERSFWQINQNDIGVLPQAVEYDLLAIRRDVEGPHGRAVVEVGERAGLLRDQVGVFQNPLEMTTTSFRSDASLCSINRPMAG